MASDPTETGALPEMELLIRWIGTAKFCIFINTEFTYERRKLKTEKIHEKRNEEREMTYSSIVERKKCPQLSYARSFTLSTKSIENKTT